MQSYGVNELRKMFLKFFESKGDVYKRQGMQNGSSMIRNVTGTRS